jgi:hypothetical protein
MSKRLFIWIGLIILVGVIAAAGWSAYVTFNRPATEAPPPPVRGKIPQIPPTSAAKKKTHATDTRMTPAPQPRNADLTLPDQLTEQTSMTPQER